MTRAAAVDARAMNPNPREPSAVGPVVARFRAMTNTERQQNFRERNPGYYGRLYRKRKAELEAVEEHARQSDHEKESTPS
jgi:hypothetical protein